MVNLKIDLPSLIKGDYEHPKVTVLLLGQTIVQDIYHTSIRDQIKETYRSIRRDIKMKRKV